MPVQNVKLPASSRRGAPSLTDKELGEVVKMLTNGDTPGPTETFGTRRECRKIMNRWSREVMERAADKLPEGRKLGTVTKETEPNVWIGALLLRPAG